MAADPQVAAARDAYRKVRRAALELRRDFRKQDHDAWKGIHRAYYAADAERELLRALILRQRYHALTHADPIWERFERFCAFIQERDGNIRASFGRAGFVLWLEAAEEYMRRTEERLDSLHKSGDRFLRERLDLERFLEDVFHVPHSDKQGQLLSPQDKMQRARMTREHRANHLCILSQALQDIADLAMIGAADLRPANRDGRLPDVDARRILATTLRRISELAASVRPSFTEALIGPDEEDDDES